jgi:hypothetical protein
MCRYMIACLARRTIEIINIRALINANFSVDNRKYQGAAVSRKRSQDLASKHSQRGLNTRVVSQIAIA